MEEMVKMIQLTDRDYEQVRLLARAWEISDGEVVRRLLDDFAKPGPGALPDGLPATSDDVPIYADYEGTHIEAIYHTTTKRVDITNGMLGGQSYKSPSGAAMAVVKAYNPKVHPNRNGWDFWFITKNNEALQTIRP
ncbi:hypothetical protein [Amycolatopsis thailandensis]|uniref:hypothetical protein n=1 Tax=Amycolatopsis thailandensis TaxID=589330 RepID=UPI0036335799